MAIEVTVTDTETGESETATVEDFLLITAAPYYVAHRQMFPTKGTTIVTIKRDEGDAEG